MSYDGNDMMANAENHYRAACQVLQDMDRPGIYVPLAQQAALGQRAHAEAAAGLLACELGRFAGAYEPVSD